MARNQQGPSRDRTRQLHDPRVRPADGAQPAANLGLTARNAKFSGFGAYLQRLAQALQGEWEALLRNSRTQPPPRTYVMVPFILDASGAVVRLGSFESTSDKLGVAIAASAVTNCAPFAQWSDDMKRTLNAEEELRVTFYYP